MEKETKKLNKQRRQNGGGQAAKDNILDELRKMNEPIITITFEVSVKPSPSGNNYTPFGEAWEKEMMKHSKAGLYSMLNDESKNSLGSNGASKTELIQLLKTQFEKTNNV
jgi:hypothetical protein